MCPKHYEPPKGGRSKLNSTHHVNTTWCFICSRGGSLICCELCPSAFHAECLDLDKPPEGKYFCDHCESGRRPLYGEGRK